MKWNWQLPDWPDFTFDADEMSALESEFLVESGRISGQSAHLPPDERQHLLIELLSNEAVQTSKIEGEILDRDSVRSSLLRNFGIKPDSPAKSTPGENGIAAVLADLWEDFAGPLSHSVLHHWHSTLMHGQLAPELLGGYRPEGEPMQIVSGDPYDPEIHFEAPPSETVEAEMTHFMKWFDRTRPQTGQVPLPALTRAALAHVHFESVHPYVDGNGRLGRVLSEKALFQALGSPILLPLSQAIEAKRIEYYNELAKTRFTNAIGEWVLWFGRTTLSSLENARSQIEFFIHKTNFFAMHGPKLNRRQEKVIRRMFEEGPAGFRGGLSAGNYLAITKTSPATARRDLGELVRIGALSKTGERKGTRYHLRPETG